VAFTAIPSSIWLESSAFVAVPSSIWLEWRLSSRCRTGLAFNGGVLLLEPDQAAAVVPGWLSPEQPGPLVPEHVLQTGNGACFVDRWPAPRAGLVMSGTNYALLGDPGALDAADLRTWIDGFVDAPAAWAPWLRAAFPAAAEWPRVSLTQTTRSVSLPSPRVDASIRPLTDADAYHVWGLPPDVAWISNTWGGPRGLAASGFAWGAFVDGRLAALACSFYVANLFEDIGVVTLSAHRGRGLSPACTAALCADIHARGRIPSWSTSPDNAASLRVAEKLGFALHRYDRLWVIGRPVPAPAQAEPGP
jgi:RimJ/RimL family protein N-acetyltransferase